MKEKNFKNRSKILIIGSFPSSKKKKIYGGQLTACKALINSEFSKKFKVFTLNSSFFSNPPPNFLIRSFFALVRIINFIYKIWIYQPAVILIFIADKFSAIEKGIMILIAKIFNKSVMIFPRAGALINQYYKHIYFKKFINFSFSKSDIFLSQGKTFQDFAINQLRFAKNNAPIIPNWTANYNHLTLGRKRNYKMIDDCPKILFLGWLEEFKGVKEILTACKILKQKKYNFHTCFAGDGSYKNDAINFIKMNDLQDCVSLVGWADEIKKSQLLESSNIFLLPSWNEGFPNSLIEAMSAGLASIVTKVGMIPDFTKNGENCLLIEPKNVPEIVSSLEKLFKNRQLTEKIGRNGHLYANSNFTLDNGLELLSKEIQKLLL